jgi:hypothetical protein
MPTQQQWDALSESTLSGDPIPNLELNFIDRGTSWSDYVIQGECKKAFTGGFTNQSNNGLLARILSTQALAAIGFSALAAGRLGAAAALVGGSAALNPPAGYIWAVEMPGLYWVGQEYIPYPYTNSRFPAGEWKLGSVVETQTFVGDTTVVVHWELVTLADATDPGTAQGWILSGLDFLEDYLGGIQTPFSQIGVWRQANEMILPKYIVPQTGPTSGAEGNGTGSRPSTSGTAARAFPWIIAAAVLASVLS